MIKLGSTVKDRVTGLVGVAENRATFLYGVDRYCVQPPVGEDGKVPDSHMVDEPQLEVLDKPIVMEPLPEPEQTIPLGRVVYDPVAGKEGTATGRAVYLNGCSRIVVEPKVSKLSTDNKGWWVYEQQLELCKTLTKKDKTTVVPKPKDKTTGGPAPSSSKY